MFVDIGKILGGIDLDDVRGAVDLVVRNKDILDKLQDLPAMLSTFGDRLADAGGQARNAANALVGDDGKGGAASALGAIGATLDGCKEQLGTATSLLGAAANAAKSVPLMGGPAGQVADGVQAVAKVVDQLGELGGHMRHLAEVITQVGGALGGLGDRLGDSGATARGFAAVGPPAVR